MDKTYTVYIHTVIPTMKRYVGMTSKDVNRRWNKNGSGYKTQESFWNDICKYGWDNVEHEIIASNLTKDEAENFERLLINKLNTCNDNFGYNIQPGGLSVVTQDARTKRKMSALHTGNKNPFYNHKHTDKTKAYLHDIFSGDKSPTYMRKHTEEERKRMRENHANVSGRNNPAAKSVMCIETGKVYPSSYEAHLDTNAPQSGISANCCGRQKSCGGYHWMYV